MKTPTAMTAKRVTNWPRICSGCSVFRPGKPIPSPAGRYPISEPTQKGRPPEGAGRSNWHRPEFSVDDNFPV